ncbi:MAG TPA: hypothetical protein VIT65_04155 [Microlunatus sp.]
MFSREVHPIAHTTVEAILAGTQLIPPGPHTLFPLVFDWYGCRAGPS